MFVVYTHSKPNGDVFYVGKGSIKRSKSTSDRNRHWHNIVNKHGFAVAVVAEFQQESDALQHEMELIARFRSDGIKLANITAGGDGVTGYRHSEETRKKLSEFQRVFQNTEKMVAVHKRAGATARLPERRAAHSAKIKAHMAKPENRERSRQGALKQASDPAYIEAQRERATLRMRDPKYRLLLAKKCVCVETGVVYESYNSATAWLRSIGRTHAHHSKIAMCISGERKSAYGYHWATIQE